MTTSLDSLLSVQLGIITHEQALDAGFTKHEIAWRVRTGEWRRMYRGVYLTTSGAPLFEQWCVAALLRAGPEWVLWGRTAARLHHLDGFKPPPERWASDQGLPIVVAADHSARKVRNLRRRRLALLTPGDCTQVENLRCATVVRTLIELAEHATWKSMVMAFEDLHRRGLHRELAEQVAAFSSHRPWLGQLVELMARRGPEATATESPLEAVCDDILWRAGLRAVRQFPVLARGSVKRLDLAFPEFGLAIECDGKASHDGKPFDEPFEADRERWALLTAQGWSVQHFTWKSVKNEVFVRQTVRDALLARGWRGDQNVAALSR